jgi:hypothetical protein
LPRHWSACATHLTTVVLVCSVTAHDHNKYQERLFHSSAQSFIDSFPQCALYQLLAESISEVISGSVLAVCANSVCLFLCLPWSSQSCIELHSALFVCKVNPVHKAALPSMGVRRAGYFWGQETDPQNPSGEPRYLLWQPEQPCHKSHCSDS